MNNKKSFGSAREFNRGSEKQLEALQYKTEAAQSGLVSIALLPVRVLVAVVTIPFKLTNKDTK